MGIQRGKKIVLLAHCIINANAKVHGLGNYSSMVLDLITLLHEHDIGVIQLPCPEMSTYGVKRWGHVREQFDTPFFREQCRKIAGPIVDQLRDYARNGYAVIGVVGVDGSPSCGVFKSCSGDWGGEIAEYQDLLERISSVVYVDKPGIFMEELRDLLNKNNIVVPFTAVDEINLPSSIGKIKNFIEQNTEHQ